MTRMYCTRLRWLLAGVPVLALAGADTQGTTASVGFTAQSFHYRENDTDGIRLDRERGWLPGLHAAVEHDFGSWFAGAGLDWSAGTVDYAAPVADSTTDTDLRQLELRAGRPLWQRGRARLHVVAGLGMREWRRDIRNTTNAIGQTVYGQDETYRWGYALLGVRSEYGLQPGTRLALDLQLIRTLNPEIKARFRNGWDSVRLDLGERTGYRVSLSLERRLDQRRSLWLSTWYEYQALGRSAVADLTAGGVPIGSVSEPDSETGLSGLSAGIRWRFR